MGDYIYKKMIQESPIAYICVNVIRNDKNEIIDAEVIRVNKAFEELSNIDRKDLIGKRSNDIIANDQMREWYYAILETIKSEKYEFEKYVDVINRTCKVECYNEDGEYIHFRVYKISESAFKLPMSIKKAPFPAWIKDRNGKYLDVSEKYLEVENIKYSDIIGKTDYDLVEKEKADEYIEEDQQVIEENEIHVFKHTVEKKSETKYFEIAKWPHIDDETNIVIGTMGISVETTNEVELIKEAKENQELFLQIVNNIDDIIFIREKDKIIYINKAFEKVHGIKPEELNLHNDINRWADHWDEVEIEKEFKPYEYNETDTMLVKVTKDKEDKWFYARYCPILDENGEVVRKVCIVSDMTNAKKLELQMEKLRMDFFANLSHELRTPLNLILSSYQVLKLRMNKLNTEEFEYFDRYLNIIKQNSYRLLKLINNLIDSTKLDSNSFTHNPKNRDIIRCVEDICMSVCEFIESNNLNLIFDTNVEEKIISFDQDNIERIMLNLISNAIKFNKDNGMISVEINCEEDVKISVKDNGIGIPYDKLDTIFGRFEQVKNKMNNNREGSGIGLSLVKSLVNMHDGNISVKSKLGEGSEFIITLPDVLIEGEKPDVLEFNNNLKNITKMNVEFSDIYI